MAIVRRPPPSDAPTPAEDDAPPAPKKTEETRRRASMTARGREQALILRPREHTADTATSDVPNAPLHPLKDADEGVSRHPIFPNSRGLPATPNVAHPSMPAGGNPALRPEDMGPKPRDPNNPPPPPSPGDTQVINGRGRLTAQGSARANKTKRLAPDPRTALPGWSGFTTPRDEFVRSLENWGAGVSLAEIARRWNRAYAAIIDGSRKEQWQAQREEYQRNLKHRTEQTTIQKIAEEQAKLEANAIAVANAQMARIAARIEQRANAGEEFQAKDDLALMRAFDATNRILRRNSGMPETSHEVRSRAEFLHDFLEKIGGVLMKYIHDSNLLRSLSDDLDRLARAYGIGAAEDGMSRVIDVDGGDNGAPPAQAGI